MSLVSSDDDEIDMLAARHFKQVSFRTSPARLNDGGYFLLPQKRCDAFLKIALKILLNFPRIRRQRQLSFVSEPARFIRRPVAVEYRWFGIYRSHLAGSPNLKQRHWQRKNRIPQEF